MTETKAETETEKRPPFPLPDADDPLMYVARNAWARKEEGVAEDDDYDITPEVSFFRDGKLLALVVMGRVNRNDALAAAAILIPGMNADRVFVTFDAHVSSEMINPATGEQWAPGEMQTACNEDGACDLGLITDCILTHEVRPDGYIAMLNRKYHINHEAKKVHWVEGEDGRVAEIMVADELEDTHLSGLVPDTLRQIMADVKERGPASPPLEVLWQLTETEEPTPELIDIHTRIAMTRLFLLLIGGAALLFGENEEERDAIATTLTEESVHELAEAMGPLVPALRARFGLDS